MTVVWMFLLLFVIVVQVKLPIPRCLTELYENMQKWVKKYEKSVLKCEKTSKWTRISEKIS